MTSNPAIELHGLTKRYGGRVAVDDLTASIPSGKVTGFIGPNGAGKTTTMAMLLGLVTPTSGGGHVLGVPMDRPDAFLGRVGALVEGPAFWPGLTGVENLRALAALAGHDAARVGPVLELVGLSQRGNDRYGTYSLGMKQRLGIAAAMLGDPELLVLDEPVNGLDPTGMAEMRQLIGSLAADGRTVLVSSHLLSELEQVADWLLVIDHGRAIYEGPTSELTSDTPPTIVLQPDRAEDVERLVAIVEDAAADAGLLLRDVAVKQPALESRYLAMVEGGDK
jgi:ABC-2 type transport system ATP-binding protein